LKLENPQNIFDFQPIKIISPETKIANCTLNLQQKLQLAMIKKYAHWRQFSTVFFTNRTRILKKPGKSGKKRGDRRKIHLSPLLNR
jgi:hypothetical protein